MGTVKNLVSVIMSNYNTPEDFLRSSIESVLNQTYKNFEFIIIDDCSTNGSLDIIQSYEDERIVVLKNEENLGITKSLNRGLAAAKGEFVARMDSDDICLETRFAKQVEFLKNNPQVIVCGTAVEFIGDWQKNGDRNLYRPIPEKELFRIYLLFGNYPNIVHPSAMFNHEKLLEFNIKYNEKYPCAQDFRMWVSCSQCGECANIPEILLNYRIHGGAVSMSRTQLQKDCAVGIMKEQLKLLELDLPEEYEEFHNGYLLHRSEYSAKNKKWLVTIIKQNRKCKIYDCEKLEKVIWKKWAEIVYFSLRKQKNPIKATKILFSLPVTRMSYLLEIRNERKNKFKGDKE